MGTAMSSSPGDNGNEWQKRMGDNVDGRRRTNNDKQPGKHVDKETQRGGVVSWEDEVGLRFYMQYVQADFCSESMPHLSAELA